MFFLISSFCFFIVRLLLFLVDSISFLLLVFVFDCFFNHFLFLVFFMCFLLRCLFLLLFFLFLVCLFFCFFLFLLLLVLFIFLFSFSLSYYCSDAFLTFLFFSFVLSPRTYFFWAHRHLSSEPMDTGIPFWFWRTWAS